LRPPAHQPGLGTAWLSLKEGSELDACDLGT